jgi:hypothetical protein
MYRYAARRTRELAATTKQATYVNYFQTCSLGEEPELHRYLKTGLHVRRLPRKPSIQWLGFGLVVTSRRLRRGGAKGLGKQENIGYAQCLGSYWKRGPLIGHSLYVVRRYLQRTLLSGFTLPYRFALTCSFMNSWRGWWRAYPAFHVATGATSSSSSALLRSG